MIPFVNCKWDDDQIGMVWNAESLKDSPTFIQTRGLNGQLIQMQLHYDENRDVALGLPLYYSNPKGAEILLAYFQ